MMNQSAFFWGILCVKVQAHAAAVAAAATNPSTYFALDGCCSWGRLRGVHTGSPTNSRIACVQATQAQQQQQQQGISRRRFAPAWHCRC
jgi:hypothetical protein